MKIIIEVGIMKTKTAIDFLKWLNLCPLAEVEMNVKTMSLIKKPQTT